jgi:hypothetical protein
MAEIPFDTLIRPTVARLAERHGMRAGAAPEAMLVAIGLQESGFEVRDQIDAGPAVVGPATGFWQFERGGGVTGVMFHHRVGPIASTLVAEAGVKASPDAVWRFFTTPQGDPLACAFARMLLFADPQALPAPQESAEDSAWQCYLRNWRPGKPHRNRWGPNWARACAMVGGGA